MLSNGGLKCWGFNGEGQLGDGSTVDQPMPIVVVGLTGIRAIALGYDHSCALTNAHGIKCWGHNGFGEFGNGSNISSHVPVDGGLTSSVSSLTAGDFHTCAITTDGALKCWGFNLNGQIGSGTSVQTQLAPASVIGLDRDVVAVSGGGFHTCALTIGGQFCFGNDSFGQLGDGATGDRNVPVKVQGLDFNARSISAGLSHTCAILTNGDVKCWGQNFGGQLGDCSTTNRNTPVAVVRAGVEGCRPFRDIRREFQINFGPDFGGTYHDSVNFSGSAGAAGDTWITAYDTSRLDPASQDIFGSVSLTADVLIHAFNNAKGAGLLALYNEALGKKGLALIVIDNGSTDRLVLSTVNQAGQLVTLKTVAMGSGIAENVWYRLTMDVVVSGGNVTVTGEVFAHSSTTDPDSSLGAQVGATLAFSGPLPAGVDPAGEIGIIASAVSAAVDTSVTNFNIVH
jgi:hypothetical protein